MTDRRFIAPVAVLIFLAVFSMSRLLKDDSDVDLLGSVIDADAIPGEYIVHLEPEAWPADILKENGIDADDAIVYKNAFHGFAAKLTESQVRELRKRTDVDFVEPDYVITAAAQELPTGANRTEADISSTANINSTGPNLDVDIAIVDSGVEQSHPDLDVFVQVNFSSESDPNDLNGHGTHVAGIAAAIDNGIGTVGVAPGARIWSVKVLDKNGKGRLSNLISAIDFIATNANQIDVANVSLTCACVSQALDCAIASAVSKGILFTVAAGNAAKDTAGFNPASNLEVLAVSAVADFNGLPGAGAAQTCRADQDDTLADFSNFGPAVDLAAPGVCIKSTWKGGGYQIISGTSMAAPHVAGAAALYVVKNGKPKDALAAGLVRKAIVAAGRPQASPSGFTGDTDGVAEPLLNVASF